MHSKWATRGAVVLAALATMSVTGCAPPESEDEIKILYFVPTLEDSSYAREKDAAEKEVENFPDVTLNFESGAGRFAAQEIIAKIQNGVTTGTDAIVVNCGATCDQLQPALADAISEGVEVIVLGQPVPGLEGYSSFVQLRVKEGAIPAGKYMAEQLSDGGEIGIIRCVVGNPVTEAREAGFLEGLEGSEVEVVARADAECDPAKARSIMENFLTAHPNLEGVFSDTDVALVGALQAIPESRDLVVVGHDATAAVLNEIKAGKVHADVQFNNEMLATMGLHAAIKAASGEDVLLNQYLPLYPLVTKDNADEVLDRIAAHAAS